jgi:hypothetical protein
MPTENRSSNTEMVSDLLPCPFCKAAMRIESNRDWHRAMGDHDEQCVFTDSETVMVPALDDQRALLVRDWNRRTQPAPQPHPEPIAWMVGTAFWWSKEEAERDAAAMGLQIVGLGPMAGIAPAQQHQGDPVAVLYANGTVLTKADCGDVFDICCKVETPLYTHADPGEVERLRAKIEQLRTALKGTQKRWAKLETALLAQLAERDALLREAIEGDVGEYILGAAWHIRARALLLASAEPQVKS